MPDVDAAIYHAILALAALPFSLGITVGALLTIGVQILVAKAYCWISVWLTTDTPNVLQIKALVAAAKLPTDRRRLFVANLRALWGVGVFRVVP